MKARYAVTVDHHGVRGVDEARTSAWLAPHLPEPKSPLSFTQLTGGHSNITVLVENAAGARWILRRPPLAGSPGAATLLLREARMLSALSGTGVPIPQVLATCDDPEVTGAPFFVMDFVDGVVLGNPGAVEAALPEAEQRVAATHSLIDTLAALHSVDLDSVGLADLRSDTRYIDRQLARDAHRVGAHEDPRGAARRRARRPALADDTRAHRDRHRARRLPVRQPRWWAPILQSPGCSTGSWQPTATCWPTSASCSTTGSCPRTTPRRPGWRPPPTRAGGFPSRSEVAELYATRTGTDISDLPWFRAFAGWRMAVIAEGVKRRYDDGGLADSAVDSGRLSERVRVFAELAMAHLA